MQLPYPLRAAGQRLFGGLKVEVRSGINQGRRWSLVSSGRGYASGLFGRDRLEAMAALVSPGDCVLDLGAHKGFMSLAAARMVGPTGVVVAVEPGATNLAFLRKHLAWNEADQVRVVRAAVGERSGTVTFGGRGDSLAYRVGVGTDEVPLLTIPELLARANAPLPSLVKMDVEEQELAALRGAGPVLGGAVSFLISVHSRELFDACSKLLEIAGFILFPSKAIRDRLSAAPPTWGSDHDLLAIGPDRVIDRARIEALELISGPG